MDKATKSVVIVGGGTAGWMAAASLSKFLAGHDISITLIESADIGTVGVGEATLPAIREFNHYLGLDEVEFIKATNATFKLGIEFQNWHQLGNSFFHPFAGYGAPMHGVDFYHHWHRAKVEGAAGELGDYCLATQLAMNNKFAQPSMNNNNPLSVFNYAFHFDAIAYARYLRQFAEQAGVKRIEQRISKVHVGVENGDIESVELQDGRVIAGDLFIDCSGFAGLLIKKALHVGYDDWRHWLPCDSAIAVPCQSVADITPYTQSIAMESGWRWRIPLQHRTGNGVVFCSDYMSESQATDWLLGQLDGEPLADPNVIRFITGKRQKMWHKNCVAIGLASGFLEPLESTSIAMIQNGISHIHQFFPFAGIKQIEVDEVNRLNDLQYERIRDFIILHYCATQRIDTPFWQHCQRIDIPDSLKHKIELFKQRGHLIKYDGESFERDSWLSILSGMAIMPEQVETSAQMMPQQQLHQQLQQIQHAIEQGVGFAGSHAAFINKHCKAGA
ncbi:tryptophan halogenase [Neiella marina]|uniref:Tryptophan halogenase n=1 Tax=Neiella marina TaxID=508461 RepID=A0A8J2U660_9GAMM|nr:tryptophan halogenase family protein [Neiella marina]GGA81199.1 tryptophan halogenase [Neiella marina]